MPLSEGHEAPDFELENQRRELVRLSSFRGRRNVVLAFHPLAFTPVCEGEMCAIERDWARLQAAGTDVLAISVDSSAAKAAWARSLGGVSFDLLADFHPHGAVAARYGVLRPEGIADRALFLVDRKGIIRYARVYDVPETPDQAELLQAVESLRA
jgi:peroxiredoxin